MGLRGRQKAVAAAVQTASLLIVRIGENIYALPSHGVRGVLTKEEGGSTTTIKALGITYSDVDLAARLSLTLDQCNPDMRVVLYSNDQTNGAIRVDEVIGMVEMERDQCKPLPPQFHGEERTWISGTTTFRDRLALIFSPEWVLGELGEAVSVGSTGSGIHIVDQSGLEGERC